MEGKPLAIGGKAYERGIGMHSEATFELQVHPGAEKFIAAVGVDDEVGKNGCVEFVVYADSKPDLVQRSHARWRRGQDGGGGTQGPCPPAASC